MPTRQSPQRFEPLAPATCPLQTSSPLPLLPLANPGPQTLSLTVEETEAQKTAETLVSAESRENKDDSVSSVDGG